MDFLKSAVASAIAKGPPFPYTWGDRVDLDQSIWTMFNGTRREDGSDCSIFHFDITANKSRLPLAKNAVKKLRTLRHPGVIKVLDTVETDTYIYVATERLVPLRWLVKRKSLSPETLKWGLYSIARTVKFINEDATSIHGSLKVASVYTSESGEWKLGGFEVLSNVKDDDAIIYNYGSLVPDSARYTPPELAGSGWAAIKRNPTSAVDSFNFGTLILEVFNGEYIGVDQAGQTKSVPPSMHSAYKRLLSANPKSRLSVGHFLEQGQRHGAFFDTPLIKLTDGVDNLGVKSETEREAFLDDLDELADDFPEDFFKMKVLPELLKSVEFGGGGPKAFGVVMKIGAKLSNDDFDSRVTPVVIRLFGNPDRAIRVCLLDSLPLMIDRLPQKVVNDKIFPQIVGGFTDLAPVVREQTLKSVLTLITKLSDRTINGELLKYLAKTANDEQPGIRTNTTICLGKIAKYLGSSTRTKVLIAAFTRSMRDPFVHGRNAALMALAVTSEYFSDEDCACRVLPAMSPALIDKEKLVRDQASKTMDIYLQKIRKAAAGMPDSILPPQSMGDSVARMSTPQPSEQAAASWTGWAISSFTNKLSATAGEMQSSANGPSSRPSTASSSSAPTVKRPAAPTSSASTLARQALTSPPPSATLSRTSSASNIGADSFFPEPDSVDEDNDAWGDMDGGSNDAGGDSFWDLPASDTPPPKSPPSSTTLAKPDTNTTTTASAKPTASTTASKTPFGADDDEPDFAGWLAAKSGGKKAGGPGKTLPKGLTKSSTNGKTAAASTAATKKAPVAAAKPSARSATTKKVDTAPKKTDDDDGWGDGW